MGTIKTAISLDESLFEQAEALAHEMHISRSRLFVLALEEYVRRREDQQLLATLNAVYEDGLDPAEDVLLRRMRRQQRQIVEGEW